MRIDGILNVNKPAGMTSFDVVRLVRRLSRQRPVGHAGTLDPNATGVLPVCLGQATRLIPFAMESRKTYLAGCELGVCTDTYDAEGTVTAVSDPTGVAEQDVRDALPAFTGAILQRPPMYSAVKHDGRRLYELARAGVEVERRARRAEVFALELVEWRPPWCTIVVECGKGTYVRSLVHDLGQHLGCGAHVKTLCRLRCGPFAIDDSLSIAELEAAFEGGYWEGLVYPKDVIVEGYPAVVVDREQERAISHGQTLALSGGDDGGYCRAYSADGHFLALLRFLPERDVWQPDRVFPRA